MALTDKLAAVDAWLAAVRSRNAESAQAAVADGRAACISEGDPFVDLFDCLDDLTGRLRVQVSGRSAAAEPVHGGDEPVVCSFCGIVSTSPQAGIVVAGPTVFICEGCAVAALEAFGGSGTTTGRCSFCIMNDVQVFARQAGQMCSQCAGICADIRKDHEREASAWR